MKKLLPVILLFSAVFDCLSANISYSGAAAPRITYSGSGSSSNGGNANINFAAGANITITTNGSGQVVIASSSSPTSGVTLANFNLSQFSTNAEIISIKLAPVITNVLIYQTGINFINIRSADAGGDVGLAIEGTSNDSLLYMDNNTMSYYWINAVSNGWFYLMDNSGEIPIYFYNQTAQAFSIPVTLKVPNAATSTVPVNTLGQLSDGSVVKIANSSGSSVGFPLTANANANSFHITNGHYFDARVIQAWTNINIGFVNFTGNAAFIISNNIAATNLNIRPFFNTAGSALTINNQGNIGIGTVQPLFALHVSNNLNTPFEVDGSINDYLQFNIQNKNTGSRASSDIVATAPYGSDTLGYVDFGANGPNGASEPFTNGYHGYIYFVSSNAVPNTLHIGAPTTNGSLAFYAGNASLTNPLPKLTIGTNGAVGISNGLTVTLGLTNNGGLSLAGGGLIIASGSGFASTVLGGGLNAGAGIQIPNSSTYGFSSGNASMYKAGTDITGFGPNVPGSVSYSNNVNSYKVTTTTTQILITNINARGILFLQLAFDDAVTGLPSCTVVATNMISTNNFGVLSPAFAAVSGSVTNHYSYPAQTNCIFVITDTSGAGAAVRVLQSQMFN